MLLNCFWFLSIKNVHVVVIPILAQGVLNSMHVTSTAITITYRCFPHESPFEKLQSLSSLKWKCRPFDEIVITGCTGSCHFDNFQCSQWWKFRQNDDISVSMLSGAFPHWGRRIITCFMFGTNPLSEPMMGTSLLDGPMGTNFNQIIEIQHFQYTKINLKCRLWSGSIDVFSKKKKKPKTHSVHLIWCRQFVIMWSLWSIPVRGLS